MAQGTGLWPRGYGFKSRPPDLFQGGHTQLEITSLSAADVVIAGPDSLDTWREANRIEVPGAKFTPRFKKKQWDGIWMPGSWCRIRGDGVYELRCARGLLPRVVEGLGSTFVPDRHWAQAAVDYLANHPKASELRDFQKQAFVDVIANGWGRIAFATNAGKGAVIALLCGFAFQQGHNSAILCDEKEVYVALLGELRKWGGIQPVLVRAISDGGVREPPTELCVTLAMVQSLAERLTDDADDWGFWLKGLGMLCLDEADKATAPTWRAIARRAKNTTWRAGFSGTFPDRMTYEDWRLEEIMGPVLAEASNKELIELGISARPAVELHGFDATAYLRGKLPSWKNWKNIPAPGRRLWTYDLAITFNVERHLFIASLIRPAGRTVVIVNRIPHGEQLAETIGAPFLDGSMTTRMRDAVLNQFRDGNVPVIVVTKILDRGSNRLGSATDLIFASGEGSDRQTLQRIGRGLRRADGKAALRLVDVIDRVNVEVLEEDKEDKRFAKLAEFLHRAGRNRVQLYREEEFDVEVIS